MIAAPLLAEEEMHAHLEFALLERLADQQADADESTRRHLAGCAICRRELGELRQFAAAWQRQQAERAEYRLSWRQRAIWLGAAAALLLLVGLLAIGRSRPATTAAGHAPPPPSPRGHASSALETVVLLDGSGPIRRRPDGGYSGLPSDDLQPLAIAVLDGAPLPHSSLAAHLPGGTEQLRGTVAAEAGVALLTPVGVVTSDEQPEFHWRSRDGDRYRVEVFDEELRPVVAGAATADSWRPSRPLPRGRMYVWQLRVERASTTLTVPSPPTPPARFYVLDATAAREIADARRNGSHLVAAVVFARHGMAAEARRELEALARLNPGAAIPLRLLGELRRGSASPEHDG
jgi:hypothetical protein